MISVALPVGSLPVKIFVVFDYHNQHAGKDSILRVNNFCSQRKNYFVAVVMAGGHFVTAAVSQHNSVAAVIADYSLPDYFHFAMIVADDCYENIASDDLSPEQYCFGGDVRYCSLSESCCYCDPALPADQEHSHHDRAR